MSLAWFPPSETEQSFGQREPTPYELHIEQARGLFGAQRALAMHGFPKDVTALLENVWVKLYQDDLVDEDGFISWRDNDTHEKTTKNPALIQGGPFLIWLVESESSTDVSSDGE